MNEQEAYRENIALKIELTLMSFAPLFILMAIKYGAVFAYLAYMKLFFKYVHLIGWLETIRKTFDCIVFWNLIVFVVSILWVFLSLLVYISFKDIQNNGYSNFGEVLGEVEYENDAGVTYFVTYVLPLLLDNVDSFRNFIVFVVLLCIIVNLIGKSALFYQNPVLTILGYKTFKFKMKYPYGVKDEIKEKQYIGITSEMMVYNGMTVKRKYLADNVYLVRKS